MLVDKNGLEKFVDGIKTYLNNKFAPKEETNILTFSSPNSFTLATANTTKNWDGILEYSTDKTNWTTWDGITTLSSVNDGIKDNLYLKGTGNTLISGGSGKGWMLTGSNISCNGDIENLLDYMTVKAGQHPAIASNCFSYLFDGNSSLISCPKILMTTITNFCCQYMFRNCTNLETLPKLYTLSMKMSCYQYMFSGCSKIKLSTIQVDDYINEYRIPIEGTGSITLFSLTSMFANTGGTFTGNPSVNTIYYTSNEVI